MKKIRLLSILLFAVACTTKKSTVSEGAVPADTLVAEMDNMSPDYRTDNEEAGPKETRLRYSDFTVVIHDFDAFEDVGVETRYHPPSSYDEEENKAMAQGKFNIDEKGLEDYEKALIVKADTLVLWESFGEYGNDNRINNTLIQIVPGNKNDSFKVSSCYLSTLNEIIDHRNYSDYKEVDALNEKALHISEKTAYVKLKDSAGYFFRALPHSPDMEAIKVVNGEIKPVKPRNTKRQVRNEQEEWENEIGRIKKKYSLKDTLVVIPGEYSTVATLTKNKKLFGYGYDSFLFRIERFRNGKKAETKYIVVQILYGC